MHKRLVEENDLVILDSVKKGTIKVLASCENMDKGQWYCVTHLYRCPKEEDFANHLNSGLEHLIAWICDEHGIEVP